MRKLLLAIPVLVLLVCIRIYEADLFYDPLLLFFSSDLAILPLPELDLWKLIGSTSLRFLSNTLLSILILWIVFRNCEVVKVSLLLYGILFAVLMLLFFILLKTTAVGDHLPLFYARRFLIQPLFLLILLPAFYVQHKK